jgi:hypothetical protein
LAGNVAHYALGAATLVITHHFETSSTWLAQVIQNATGNLTWQHKCSTSTHTTYLWADGARQATVPDRAQLSGNYGEGSAAMTASNAYGNRAGQSSLTAASVYDGRSRKNTLCPE